MCGIAGFVAAGAGLSEADLHRTILAMTDSLVHRGPDAGGVWTDASTGVALGHRRLSILDLSAAGSQPMASPDGRYIIVYNGEIYNFLTLREELSARGHGFRGHSDTEVLLAAIAEWGIERTLERANGMFAFALWDAEARTLTLARDRAGKKPLYYGWCGSTLLFASELKALRAHPRFDAEIDRDALGLFVQYGWVPGPYSIYRRIRKLPAATYLTLPLGASDDAAIPEAYWSARETAERGARTPFAGTYDDAMDALEALLTDAVQGRLVADVPLGALLSGGIDSSLVVALMQSISTRPVQTFSIGFDDPKYDEASHAAAVARHLGTDHTELRVTGQDGLDVVPDLPSLYDEPFADESQVPTLLVCRLARRAVTVALSGDGGDELFAGYTSYREVMARWQTYPPAPAGLGSGIADTMAVLAGIAWRAPLPRRRSLLAKLEKRARLLPAQSPAALFALKKSRVRRASDFVLGTSTASAPFGSPEDWPAACGPVQTMMYQDFSRYLVDDVLVKVDRASMSVGLEMRCPLLDARVVEFAWSLPLAMRLEAAGGKRILKDVLARHVPRQLTDRPKRGFGVPLSSWLTGPLRDWAESLLAEQRLRDGGYLRPAAVRRAWQQHLAGWANHEQLIWTILMFQAWIDSTHAAPTPGPAVHVTGREQRA